MRAEGRRLIDHLMPFLVKDLLSGLRRLRESIPIVGGPSAREDFSGRGGGYIHELFARFHTTDDLQAYLERPDHLAAGEKPDMTTTGRIVADYHHDEP